MDNISTCQGCGNGNSFLYTAVLISSVCTRMVPIHCRLRFWKNSAHLTTASCEPLPPGVFTAARMLHPSGGRVRSTGRLWMRMAAPLLKSATIAAMGVG